MDSLKSLFFTFVFMTFILVYMTQSSQLQGMPLDAQLAHVASTTMQYLSELFAPLRDMINGY
jgi:hypothetical protein